VGVPYFSTNVFAEASKVGFLLAAIYSVRLSNTISSCPGTGPKNTVSKPPELSVAGYFVSLITPDIRATYFVFGTGCGACPGRVNDSVFEPSA
jgi:hypothetical protein